MSSYYDVSKEKAKSVGAALFFSGVIPRNDFVWTDLDVHRFFGRRFGQIFVFYTAPLSACSCEIQQFFGVGVNDGGTLDQHAFQLLPLTP